MKNFLKYTLVASLLTTGFAFGQNNVNETETIELQTIEVSDGTSFTMQTTSEELQIIDLENSDMNKTNQDIVMTPVMVSKVVWIDADKDKEMDRVVHVYYTKNKEADLDYLVTSTGIVLKSTSNIERHFNTEGTYQVRTKDVGNVLISIDNLNTSN